MMKKNKQLLTVTMILMLFMSLIVSAFGVGIYNDPIKIKPGESIDLAFRPQNMLGNTDYTVEPKFTWSEGINVELLDNKTIYDLPSGELIRVNFRVTADKNAKIGEMKEVRADFTPKAQSEGGEPLGIETGMVASVKILISETTGDDGQTPIEKKEETKVVNYTSKILALLALIIVVAVTIIYIRRKKKNK